MEFTEKTTKEAKTKVGDFELTYSVVYKDGEYDNLSAVIAYGDARIGSMYFNSRNMSLSINRNEDNKLSASELKTILDALGNDIVGLEASNT